MALSATIFKAELQIADLDRNYYATHSLTLARHPSETDQRLMVRLLAFALNADAALEFGKGVSNSEEPALWQRELNGDISLWIELGQPDPDRLRKAAGRARRVLVYGYGGNSCMRWWRKHREPLRRLQRLAVYELASDETQALAGLARRNMRLNCTLQDGEAWLGDDQAQVTVRPARLSLSTTDY